MENRQDSVGRGLGEFDSTCDFRERRPLWEHPPMLKEVMIF